MTAGIGIAVVASIIAMGSFAVSAIQTKRQSQVSSANLILQLLKPWGTMPIKQLMGQIMDPKIEQYDEYIVEEYLNHLETISVFWKDKTITENHTKEFFGANLKLISNDKFLNEFLKKWIEKNPDYYFINLRELIKKVDEWKL